MARLKQGCTDIAHRHSLTNVETNINILHFIVSEIWPGQYFKGQSHYDKVKGLTKVTI